MKNNVNFIFNTHLPFVRHPEFPKFLEEDWLYEAINESYIPLLRMITRLKNDKVNFHLTFSLSPTLCFMLEDPLLRQRFEEYLNSRIELGQLEVKRLEGSNQQEPARMYLNSCEENLKFYLEDCQGHILQAFNRLEKEGYLELITTAATYAYLPVYSENKVAVNAQIETGALYHSMIFDKAPEGFWLPDCGYYPGLEELISRHNIKWTSLSAQALFLGDKRPVKGNYAPIKCPNGLYCFARDNYLTSLVWSATEGYPGDPLYREFYRDIGYDLDIDYIRPYIHEPDVRVFTGYKYWAVTGKTPEKNVYNPSAASQRAKIHAQDFVSNIEKRGEGLESLLKDDPVYTLSFDSELFGHFWYEGVQWLEQVIRLCSSNDNIRLITPSQYIAEGHKVQTMTPGYSSWGENGYSQVWVDTQSNAWLCQHTIEAVRRMSEIAKRSPNQTSLKQRFLNQAARETLLLMASDWPFIIHNHSSEQYAKNRLIGHIQNLNLVYDDMCKDAVNTEWLVNAEKRNNIFPNLDYNIFNPNHLNEPSPVFTTDFTKC